MRRLQILIISILFLCGNIQASFLSPKDPYSFLPEGRTISDLRDFAKPAQMTNILPNVPVAATDSEGNRVFYSPTGKQLLSISKDGSTSFAMGNMTIRKNAKGEVTGTVEGKAGSSIYEVKNEFGEVISKVEYGLGGKTVAEYDKDGNLTKTYDYGKFGKKINYVLNEMTQGRTTFDDYGRAMADYDMDGYILATYQYEDISYSVDRSDADSKTLAKTVNQGVAGNGLLVSKTTELYDMSGNKTYNITFYDKDGSVNRTEDAKAIVLVKYNYVFDKYGNKVLESSVDTSTGDMTYYKDNKQDVTKNAQGTVLSQYIWNGSYLVCVVNNPTGQSGTEPTTTWYDPDGKQLYVTYHDSLTGQDNIISKNLYFRGQLVGVWDARVSTVTVLVNERQWKTFTYDSGSEPTADEIQSWIAQKQHIDDTGFINETGVVENTDYGI